jgi:hypothetical protein
MDKPSRAVKTDRAWVAFANQGIAARIAHRLSALLIQGLLASGTEPAVGFLPAPFTTVRQQKTKQRLGKGIEHAATVECLPIVIHGRGLNKVPR